MSIRARYRLALVMGLALATAFAGTAGAEAATTGPTAPTKLFNNDQHCSTDPSAPTYVWANQGVGLEGVPQDAAATAGTEFGAQFLVWPLSAPSQTVAYNSYVDVYPAGHEAATGVPASALTDGTTYAWQARSVVDGAVSKWSKTCYIAIDDDRPASPPTVTSANYPADLTVPGGVPVQITLGANGVSDVAGYEFAWNTGGSLPVYVVAIGDGGVPEPKSIWADTKYYVQAPSLGGDANLNLVPPTGGGPQTLTVASLDRAGTVSAFTNYQIIIQSTAPTVTPAVANPQFDTPTQFTFTPNPTAQAASPIVSYSVSIGGGTPRTYKADVDGSATVKLRLNNVEGNDGVSVTSTSANGWVSDPNMLNNYYFDTTPIVNSNDYPEYDFSGGAGGPGTFTFTAQVSNIVSYTYSLDGGVTQTTVAANAAGNAQITFTPTESDYYDLNVYGTTKDGLKLQATDYFFGVN